MGNFTRRLQNRLRDKRVEQITAAKELAMMTVPPHPSKYPKHAGAKGALYGGTCNRTACDTKGVTWFNVMTHGYYCRNCAKGIDYSPVNKPICVQVNRNLSHEEMNQMQRDHYAAKETP